MDGATCHMIACNSMTHVGPVQVGTTHQTVKTVGSQGASPARQWVIPVGTGNAQFSSINVKSWMTGLQKTICRTSQLMKHGHLSDPQAGMPELPHADSGQWDGFGT